MLVGGFNHLEKYEFVNGKDDIPYIMEKTSLKPPASNAFKIQTMMTIQVVNEGCVE
jgi:hypothetical protein